jgi:hypothetical protein
MSYNRLTDILPILKKIHTKKTFRYQQYVMEMTSCTKQESVLSCISVLGLSVWPISTIFLLYFGAVRQCGILSFSCGIYVFDFHYIHVAM